MFLVAKKSMPDPNFAGTVLLITVYDDTGAVGLALNRLRFFTGNYSPPLVLPALLLVRPSCAPSVIPAPAGIQ